MGAKFNTLHQKDFKMLIVSLKSKKKKSGTEIFDLEYRYQYWRLVWSATNPSSKGGQLCEAPSYLWSWDPSYF